MSSVFKIINGKWRALIRRNHQSISKVFLTKGSASAWAKDTERKIEKKSYEDLPPTMRNVEGLIIEDNLF